MLTMVSRQLIQHGVRWARRLPVAGLLLLLVIPAFSAAQSSPPSSVKDQVAQRTERRAGRPTPVELAIDYRLQAASNEPKEVNYPMLLLVALVLHSPIFIGIGIALHILLKAAAQQDMGDALMAAAPHTPPVECLNEPTPLQAAMPHAAKQSRHLV